MKTYIRSRQIPLDATTRAQIERRLEFSLGRFSTRIIRVNVHIVDINGPRGGEDKACRMEVRLLPTGNVFVEDRDADLATCIDRAADRIGRSVARMLSREREVIRGAA